MQALYSSAAELNRAKKGPVAGEGKAKEADLSFSRSYSIHIFSFMEAIVQFLKMEEGSREGRHSRHS